MMMQTPFQRKQSKNLKILKILRILINSHILYGKITQVIDTDKWNLGPMSGHAHTIIYYFM